MTLTAHGSDDCFALRNEGRALVVWSRQAMPNDVARLAHVAAGPICDLFIKGIVNPMSEVADVHRALTTYLIAADDGSTTSDSAVYRRIAPKLDAGETDLAIALAIRAAATAFQIYASGRGHKALTQMAKRIDTMPADEVYVIELHTIKAMLADNYPIQPKITYFTNFLEAGLTDAERAAVEEEMKLDALAVIADLAATGGIVNGMLTAEGLARLDLNE